MERLDKIKRIDEVGKKIWNRDSRNILDTELKDYDNLLKSDLPILMFLIDERVWDKDHRMEYIYYLPDLDQIRCESVYIRFEDRDYYQVEDYFMGETLDLREEFKDFEVKSLIRSTVVNRNTHPVLYSAIDILRGEIEDIFNNNEINSWEDVRVLLKGKNLVRVRK